MASRNENPSRSGIMRSKTTASAGNPPRNTSSASRTESDACTSYPCCMNFIAYISSRNLSSSTSRTLALVADAFGWMGSFGYIALCFDGFCFLRAFGGLVAVGSHVSSRRADHRERDLFCERFDGRVLAHG